MSVNIRMMDKMKESIRKETHIPLRFSKINREVESSRDTSEGLSE